MVRATEYAPRHAEQIVLHGAVRTHLATFTAIADGANPPVASFVQRAFDSYLRCGVPAHGFARFRCKSCEAERVVALSCKGRGLCPRSGGSRMSALAQHAVDRIIPHVPVRQWVLSLPHPLRYRLAYDAELCSVVLRYLYELKTPWHDGTTHVRLDPIELMERLAALIPRPRTNLVVYHGVLAPAAKHRAQAVQYGRPEVIVDAKEDAGEQSRAEREQWAELMRRSFGLDVLQCDCGDRFVLVATILNPAVARRILAHLDVQAQPPATGPPQDPPPFWHQTAEWVA